MAQPRKTFTTAKGTELPLLNLKGREYLQVAHRLVWFREEHPKGILKTQLLAHQGEGQNEYAVFKTEVFIDSDRGPMMIASGHKKETRAGFDDFMEKAETGSIGRALALAGFGTQFTADELDENDRLADAPVQVISKSTSGSISGTNTDSGGIITPAVTTTGSRSSFRKNVKPIVNGSANDDGI